MDYENDILTELPGAHYDGVRKGVQFGLSSVNATKVELCLFDEHGGNERRVALQPPLPGSPLALWTCFVQGLKPGQQYGYRVYGPFDPAKGHRFNPSKLLMDPYAKALKGELIQYVQINNERKTNQALFSYTLGTNPNDPQNIDMQDSAPFVPKSVVTAPSTFDWKGTEKPGTPWPQTVLYEAHVKGFSKLNSKVEEPLRGTYAGMAAPASINHFKKLGVTAVELMPVHEFVHDGFILDKGLKNYWGYNTLNFFTPHHEYMSGRDPDEFKAMVRTYHANGIEVHMDVVYNHTAEGNEYGPTLCYRGIDNATYYALPPQDKGHYINDTGVGNTVNANHPIVRRMIADSIRYWKDEYQIDGFRFDLLASLGRDEAMGFAFNPDAPVYKDIRDAARGVDPVTGMRSEPGSRPAKLAGEPWDCKGYQRGRLPGWFYEWNDTYKKGIRNFWMRDARSNALAAGLAGSSDVDNTDARSKGRIFNLINRMKLAATNGLANVTQALRGYQAEKPSIPEDTNPFFLPRPVRSINEIGTHDGMTLADAVSYARKHNEANKEEHEGGCDDISLNYGAEGPTDDTGILAQRMKSIFNFIATLGVSHGPILIRMGDEMMQTQKGNNNAWCQDNDISWLDWGKLNEDAPKLVRSFMEYMINVRQSLSGLKTRSFMHGDKVDPLHGEKNLTWYSPKGHYRTEDEWVHNGLCFGMMLDNAAYPEKAQSRHPAFGPRSRLLVVFNGENNWVNFKLPELKGGKGWGCMVNTSMPVPNARPGMVFSKHAQGGEYCMPPKSTVIFVQNPSRQPS